VPRSSLVTQVATKVLIVDDDSIVLDYLSQLVGAAGFAVTTASSAENALTCMQLDFAPIVILDVNLPGMDGLELCRVIRSQTYSGYVYVLLHTSKNTDADIIAGLNAGADDYLSKSTSKAQVIGRLRTAQRILSLEQTFRTSNAGNEPVPIPGTQTAVLG
jgi:DNA-binding response OmpR family regulator